MPRSMDALVGEPGSSLPPLLEGKIANTVASDTDYAEVIIPSFHEHRVWDELPWMPRGVLRPQKGDRCCVARAETEHPGAPEAWIVAWWPS